MKLLLGNCICPLFFFFNFKNLLIYCVCSYWHHLFRLVFLFFPKLDDSTVARELAITDSEHSDAEVSCTDNGTFNLSRGQTPLTEGSEGEGPDLIMVVTYHLPASLDRRDTALSSPVF